MIFDYSKFFVVLVLLAFAGLLWLQEGHFKDELTGVARIVDGDSLVIQGDRIRLLGIDAPEGRQYCQKKSGRWACGRASTSALKRMIGSQSVVCEGDGFDRHQRLLAHCRVGSFELNRAMVREGWAVSYRGSFQAEELEAKKAKRGVWQGTFVLPRDWRKAHPRF